MTTEQFDKLLAHLDKLANAQAAISQGKNRGTYASDRKTDEGRVLKACFDGLRVITGQGTPRLVSNPIVVDSFTYFTVINSSISSPGVSIQVLDCFGSWAIHNTAQNITSGGIHSFVGAFTALRIFGVEHSAWTSIDLRGLRYSLIASS
jgi:hypothetical protein